MPDFARSFADAAAARIAPLGRLALALTDPPAAVLAVDHHGQVTSDSSV